MPTLVGQINYPKLPSKIRTPHSPSIPKANDRFKTPSKQIHFIILIIAFNDDKPGPGNYSPKHNFNETVTSLNKSFGMTKFSKDERKALDHFLKMANYVPGPGNYELGTEFGTY